MSAADVFGLVVSLLGVRLPRLRALPRGAVLDERPGHLADPRLRGRAGRARLSARALHGARLRGRQLRRPGVGSRGWAGSSAASTASSAPDAKKEQDWKSYGTTVLVFSVLFLGLLYLIQRAAGASVPEPGPHEGRPRAPVAEHGRELHHEHELAVLRRRVHDVVPDPDGRARGAELRLRGGRHGGARRGRARDRAALGGDARQLLGRPLPLARLHPAARSPWS